MKLSLLLLALVLSLLLIQGTVYAQDDDDVGGATAPPAAPSDEPSQQADDATGAAGQVTDKQAHTLAVSSDVQTAFVFPQSADREFQLGMPVDILLGFKNNGKKTFTIVEVNTQLRYDQDWNVIIQNYTALTPSLLVQPGDDITVTYRFFPDPLLEVRRYGLQANLFYNDEDTKYGQTFFNSTISFVEQDTGLDAPTLFTYVGIFAFAGLLAFAVFRFSGLSIPDSVKKTAKSSVEYGTQKTTTVDSSDWLKGTAADRRRKNTPNKK